MIEAARKLKEHEIPGQKPEFLKTLGKTRDVFREALGGRDKNKTLIYLRSQFNLRRGDLDEKTAEEIAGYIRSHKDDISSVRGLILSPEYHWLIAIGLKRHLDTKFNIGWDKMQQGLRDRIVQLLADTMKSNPRHNIYEAVLCEDILSPMANKIRLKDLEHADEFRQTAIQKTEERYGFTKNWTDNKDELSNERYSSGRSEIRYLSTYFDSATFGITNKKLEKYAGEKGKDAYLDFENHVASRKNIILDYFDPMGNGEDYNKENLFFYSSATNAFEAYLYRYLRPGDVVVTTSEEYRAINELLKDMNIEVVTIGTHNNDAIYADRLRKALKKGKVKAVIASEISRRGVVLPLEVFRKEISETSPDTAFVVDGTQAIGRKRTDFSKIGPDVYFASCQKGADIGRQAGVLILSKRFTEENGSKIKSKGTQNTVAMEKITMACNKNSIDEREKRIKALSRKFITLIDAINKQNGNRIHILRPLPETLYDDKNLSGIFEMEIEGKTRYMVNKYCRQFGVFIANHYEDPLSEKRSFRIAFHPYMNDDSLKILGHVLDELSKEEQ